MSVAHSLAFRVPCFSGSCAFSEFCQMDPGVAVAADGRTFHRSDAAYDDAGAKALVKDVEVFMKFCWRYIVERGKFNFEHVGLLPVVHTSTISRTHSSSKSMSGAAIIT